MSTDGLVEWLTATLDAIEGTAREAIGEQWRADGHEVIADTGHRTVADAYGNAGMDEVDMRHIVLHDPRAVLARVAAERMVIASVSAIPMADSILYELAWGHRFDAPGYDQSWAPK